MTAFPSFQEIASRTPKYSSWIWGAGDELGTLNLLTPDRKTSAAREVKQGLSIGLNWSFEQPSRPLFNRQAVKHAVLSKPGRPVFDDSLVFNTQSGTQIDGLRHFGYPGEIFYTNVKGHQIRESGSRILGLDAAAQAGIVGRGVLIDFKSYADANGIVFDPVSTFKITVEHLEGALKAQGTTLQVGDILLVRTGFIERYEAASEDEKEGWARPPVWTGAGVEPSERMLEWLYEHHFAAVGGDAPTFEAWLHPCLLAGWGTLVSEAVYDALSFPDLRDARPQAPESGMHTSELLDLHVHVGCGVGSPGALDLVSRLTHTANALALM